ncbi:MAG: DUF5050 domain-containing protein [Clostridiales bacterium]|jgi:hypothetical protein|nr:DUF5050 domain-containing protein [Clostridiales bacterium]
MNGNIANGGLLTKWQGEVIFARSHEWFLNADDDFIYYSNRNEENRIYRKREPKEEGMVLVKSPCSGLVLFDDGIYFINENDKNVYRCSTEGRGTTPHSKKETTEFAVLDDGEIYLNPAARRLCASRGRVFFADAANDFVLTAIEVKSGEKEVYSGIKPSYINVYGDVIFYTDRMRENKIHRLDMKNYICGESAEYLHVIDDWLYFMTGKIWKKISLVDYGEAIEVA